MTSQAKTKILGLRLSEKTIRAAKSEAVRRGIPVNKLFEELWSTYEQSTAQR